MFVKNHMTANPIVVGPEDSIGHVANIMKENGIRHVPVVARGKLVGIITQTDVLKASASPATSLSIWEINYLIDKLRVKDVMVTNVITVLAEAPIEDAALLMRKHKVGSLPVVDGHSRLLGIITETDIFDALLDAFGATGTGKRLTIECEERPGILSKIEAIFANHGVDIRGLVVFHPHGGRMQIVIRTGADNLGQLSAELAQEGFAVSRIDVN